MKIRKNVYATIRISNPKMDEVKFGSITQQENAIRVMVDRLAKGWNMDLNLVDIFKEKRSAKKGTMSKRWVINEIKRLMRAGKLDMIIFERLDRFSRDQIPTLEFLEEAKKLGVIVYDMDFGKIDLNDKNCRFIVQIKTWQNQEYSIELGERVQRKGRMAMYFDGKDNSSRKCLGLDNIVDDSGFYKINEVEVEVVRDIMNKFIQFQSYKETIKYCNEMRYKTKAGRDFDLRRIQRLFKDPKLSGENFFKDTWNQFPEQQDDSGMVKWSYKHGRVIEEELIAKVKLTMQLLNKVKKTKTGKDGKVSLLSGLLKTPNGDKYYRESAGKYVYYYSREANTRLRMDEVEKQVISDIENVMLESGELKKQVERTILSGDSVVKRLNDRLGRLESEIREKTKILDGFSAKMQKLVLSDNDNFTEACELIVSEKNKVSKLLESMVEEKAELENKKIHVREVVDSNAAEKWIKKTMASFSKEPCIRKKAILSTIFKDIVYDDETLFYNVNLDPDSVGVLKCHALSRKKGEKKAISKDDDLFVISEKWRERRVPSMLN